MEGKMGIAIFLFHYASHIQDEACENQAFVLIEEIIEQLRNCLNLQ
jgi:hypothetical protein